MGEQAKLKIGPLRSNITKKLFRFNAPTYTFVDAPRGRPWSGGATEEAAVAGSSSALPTVVPNTGFSQQTAANGDVGQAKPEGVESTSAKSSTGGFGAPQLEGAEVASKAGHGHPGEVRVEGSKSVPK